MTRYSKKAFHFVALLSLMLFGLVGVTGCTEEGIEGTEGSVVETFSLEPSISVHSSARSNVRIERVFMGIGSIILEPIDDPEAPAFSTREMLALEFDLTEERFAELRVPGIELVKPGRYMISIAIEPLYDVAESAPGDDKPVESSIRIEGTLLYSIPKMTGQFDPTDPNKEPEPLPWVPTDDDKDNGVVDLPPLQHATIEPIAFAYRSERTGFIRLGEVKLSPEHNDLLIHVDLDYWLDKALAPVMAEIEQYQSSSDFEHYLNDNISEGMDLDLNTYIEEVGLELEHVFTTSSASSL